MSFLNSIINQSKKHEFPFDHYEYHNALTDSAIEEIVKADIPDVSKHNLNYDGTRAIDGGAAEFRKLFRELNIIRNLGEEEENWNYQKLDETNRVAKIIKQKIYS